MVSFLSLLHIPEDILQARGLYFLPPLFIAFIHPQYVCVGVTWLARRDAGRLGEATAPEIAKHSTPVTGLQTFRRFKA